MYNDYDKVRNHLAHFGITGQKKGLRRFQSYQVAPTQSGMVGQEVGEAAKQRSRLGDKLKDISDKRRARSDEFDRKWIEQSRKDIAKWESDFKKGIKDPDYDFMTDEQYRKQIDKWKAYTDKYEAKVAAKKARREESVRKKEKAKAASTIGNAAKKEVTGAAKGYGNDVKKSSSTYANKYKDMAKTAANIYTSSPVGASTPAGIYTANQRYRKGVNSKAGKAVEALHQVVSPNYRMAKTAQNLATAASAVNKARKKKKYQNG